MFRSTDGGKTFARMLAGAATDVVADPGAPKRLYAASRARRLPQRRRGRELETANGGDLSLMDDGVDNDGNDQVDVAETAAGATMIKLAVAQDPTASAGAPNPVYAALLGDRFFMGLFESIPTDTGADPADWLQGQWTLAPNGASAPPPATASLNSAAALGTQPPATQVIFDVDGVGASTLTRNAGDWRADGFAVGQEVTIAGAGIGLDAVRAVVSVTPLVLTLAALVAIPPPPACRSRFRSAGSSR